MIFNASTCVTFPVIQYALLLTLLTWQANNSDVSMFFPAFVGVLCSL